MAKDKQLRIVITVKPGRNQELYENLAVMPIADRSERVRTLAAIGVLAMRGQLAPAGANPSPVSGQGQENTLGKTHVDPGLLTGFDDGGWAEEN